MNKKQAARWERLRKKGKTRYILILGMIWGILITALDPAIGLLFEGPVNLDHYWAGLLSSKGLLKALIYMVLGPFFGWGIWMLSEQKYQKYKRDNPD